MGHWTLGPPVSCDSSSHCPLSPAGHSTPTQVITSASSNKCASAELWGHFTTSKPGTFFCLWKTSNTTGDSTRWAQKLLPNCLDFPFPLNLPRKLILEGSWWQQHRETSQRDELMDTNAHSHLSLRQPWQEHRGVRSVVEEEWNPEGSKGSIPTLCRGAGEVRPSHQIQGMLRFIQPAARVFLQGTTVQRCIMITLCSKVFEPACSELNEEIIFLLPTENPESTKGRRGSPGGGSSACKSRSRRGVCAYSYFTT